MKSVEYYHSFLYGRKFLIRRDYSTLQWLMSFKSTEGQIARWLEKLQTYNFEKRHDTSRSYGNADRWRRRPYLVTADNCAEMVKTWRQTPMAGHRQTFSMIQRLLATVEIVTHPGWLNHSEIGELWGRAVLFQTILQKTWVEEMPKIPQQLFRKIFCNQQDPSERTGEELLKLPQARLIGKLNHYITDGQQKSVTGGILGSFLECFRE